MNSGEAALQLLDRITLGNELAKNFLREWMQYTHEIDDIIDGDRTSKEQILATFARALILYSHPFYLANIQALRQIALNVTNAYADSVAWEKSEVDWQRNWSDHYSHVAQEMMLSIAMICGGYEHARTVSLEMRYLCYVEHHNNNNQRV
jgi:hypothetical protein